MLMFTPCMPPTHWCSIFWNCIVSFCAISSSVSGAANLERVGRAGAVRVRYWRCLTWREVGAAVNLHLRMTPEHSGWSLAPRKRVGQFTTLVRFFAVDKKSIMPSPKMSSRFMLVCSWSHRKILPSQLAEDCRDTTSILHHGYRVSYELNELGTASEVPA